MDVEATGSLVEFVGLSLAREVPDDRKPASATWQRARLAPIAARGGVHQGSGHGRCAVTVPH